MSHSDDTLQEALEQHLESLKARGKADDWLRGVVQWLIQEILDLEFTQFLGADPYPEGHRDGVNAAQNARVIAIHAVRSTVWVLSERSIHPGRTAHAARAA
jgi:transposase-like protein